MTEAWIPLDMSLLILTELAGLSLLIQSKIAYKHPKEPQIKALFAYAYYEP